MVRDGTALGFAGLAGPLWRLRDRPFRRGRAMHRARVDRYTLTLRGLQACK